MTGLQCNITGLFLDVIYIYIYTNPKKLSFAQCFLFVETCMPVIIEKWL